VLFQNFAGAGEHLSAVHVAAIRKMPDGSRSHGAFLDKRDGLGRGGVNLHCSGVAGREQIERAMEVHKSKQQASPRYHFRLQA
jgi:hypothetical protein